MHFYQGDLLWRDNSTRKSPSEVTPLSYRWSPQGKCEDVLTSQGHPTQCSSQPAPRQSLRQAEINPKPLPGDFKTSLLHFPPTTLLTLNETNHGVAHNTKLSLHHPLPNSCCDAQESGVGCNLFSLLFWDFFFFSSAGVQWSLMSSKGQILQSGFSGKWIIFWPSKNHNYRKVNLFISGTKDSRSCKAEQQMQLTKLSVALLRWKMDFTIKNQLDATPHFDEAKILYFLIIIHWAPPALTIHLVLSTMLNHLFKGNFSPW